jgi:hypothetical protein
VLLPKYLPKAAWQWRKEDLGFPCRCVIVGSDPKHDYFADVAISVDNLRKSVEFRSPAEKGWIRYADRQARATEISSAEA